MKFIIRIPNISQPTSNYPL